MKEHVLKVYPSSAPLPREKQLAWLLAEAALDPAPLLEEAEQMAICRLIDNAGVAVASLGRPAVRRAREQAMAFPKQQGATVFGLDNSYRFSAEWSAWANGAAVRELDFHDTFLAEDYAHPADSIPPLLAVAQQMGKTGQDLLRGILTAYEVHISLVKGICLHKHKIDHIAHLCPAQTAGLGALLNMDAERLYQAIQQAVHVSFTTRQSRKGEISSWKAYAPAFAGKMAIEAVDRALRGEKSPSPIYEGEDSVVAWLLDGPQALYKIPLPEKGEAKRGILESYTKAWPAEYQAQAFIDMAFELRPKISDFSKIKQIRLYSSHHTHFVIGSGSGDPQKFDPQATKETLDHSLPYIFAVALEDGAFSSEASYRRERAGRPQTVKLWQKIKTFEEARWTQLYKDPDPSKRAFGGRAEIEMSNGQTCRAEKPLADAHPFGAKPFKREDYIKKFMRLSAPAVSEKEAKRFLRTAENLKSLKAKELFGLNAQAKLPLTSQSQGIF